MNTYISPVADIDPSVYIGRGGQIYGRVSIGKNCIIGDNVIIGQHSEEELSHVLDEKPRKILDLLENSETLIGNNVVIQPYAIVHHRASIGDGVRIGTFAMVGSNTTIGTGSHLMYRAQVYENVHIGRDCKIGGFICDYSHIGDNVTVMGCLVHTYEKGWDTNQDLSKISPVIEDNVIVGFNAIVIGKVRLKSRTYVAAGAVVTKDTPGNCVVKGMCGTELIEHYKGRFLPKSKFFS